MDTDLIGPKDLPGFPLLFSMYHPLFGIDMEWFAFCGTNLILSNQVTKIDWYMSLIYVLDIRLRINQNGFRPRRSTVGQILTLHRIIEGVKDDNLPAIIIFIDFTRRLLTPYTEARWWKSCALTVYPLPSFGAVRNHSWCAPGWQFGTVPVYCCTRFCTTQSHWRKRRGAWIHPHTTQIQETPQRSNHRPWLRRWHCPMFWCSQTGAGTATTGREGVCLCWLRS